MQPLLARVLHRAVERLQEEIVEVAHDLAVPVGGPALLRRSERADLEPGLHVLDADLRREAIEAAVDPELVHPLIAGVGGILGTGNLVDSVDLVVVRLGARQRADRANEHPIRPQPVGVVEAIARYRQELWIGAPG